MSTPQLPNDPLWPRAGSWLKPSHPQPDVILVGIPTHATSLSPTKAGETPAAIRQALWRYSHTYVTEGDSFHSLESLNVQDAGDIDNPDTEQAAAISQLAGLMAAPLVIGLGGDNSATALMGKALADKNPETMGLITLDAHFDLRDGHSNGSPVRELLDYGVKGTQIAQVGIADFANSAAYAKRAKEAGITVIPRSALTPDNLNHQVDTALKIAGAGGGPIHVDIDVDVCDRSVAPACPASLPGGISAHELRVMVRRLASDPRVKSFDITEIDASSDSTDQRTIRLGALLVLDILAGYYARS